MLVALHICISIALAYFGIQQLQAGNTLGTLLLVCIVVYWSYFFARKSRTK